MRKIKFAALIVVIFAADFLSKATARDCHVIYKNSGISFGFLQSGKNYPILFLNFAVAVMLLGFAIYFAERHKDSVMATGSVVMFAGSLGNFCDRLLHGAVTDWIYLPFSNLLFRGGLWLNIADFAIIAGFCYIAFMFVIPQILRTRKQIMKKQR